MGRYAHKYTALPEGMKVGAEVYCVGEGDEVLTIDEITYSPVTKMATKILLSHGCYEPISKVFLNQGDFEKSWNDLTNWAFVAVGECDVCETTFPDSCAYHTRPDDKDSMVCNSCWEREQNAATNV